MHAPDAPGMELPGMDIPGIAAAYGVPSERVKTLSDLTRAVKDGALIRRAAPDRDQPAPPRHLLNGPAAGLPSTWRAHAGD